MTSLPTQREPTLFRPGPIERASGLVTGLIPRDDLDGLQWHRASSPGPREALEQIIGTALRRPPCVIDFSGGRDSSALLAVATHVAHREGLPLPIPRTWRFPDAPQTAEEEWQRLVVDHLQLKDWDRVTYHSELDLIGSVARDFLRRHGAVWPAPIYTAVPALSAASGGSHLNGEGGDEIFGFWRARVVRRLMGKPSSVFSRAMIASILCHLSPRPGRLLMLRRSYRAGLSCRDWMQPAAYKEVFEAVLGDLADQPFDCRESLRAHLGLRSVRAQQENLSVIAADFDVLRLVPFLDPTFVAAFARCGGAVGFGSRTEAMRFLFQDLLPDAILSRESKAIFNLAYFSDESRSFVERWNGRGVDADLVDLDALSTEWRKPKPSALSFCLLQHAWMHECEEQRGQTASA